MAKGPKEIAALTHDEARRRNLPTAELQPFLDPAADAAAFPPVAFERARPLPEGQVRQRDPDLDPQLVWNGVKIKLTPSQMKQLAETGEVEIGDAQLVWRGKDLQDWSDLAVAAPPIYVHEKIHPKAIIDDLRRASVRKPEPETTMDLFADFNGVAPDARTEFYQHEAHWTNRMILGDSLQVMASLAERERLNGQVQCIYFDPPYGIKFNSNWQVSTENRDVKDGKISDISREPEQVSAFRDTWKDGIHSYLSYIRDRLTVMRELLAESGSIFVQIGIDNVHRVASILDEVFGPDNRVVQISFVTANPQTGRLIEDNADYILWYARNKRGVKFRTPYRPKTELRGGAAAYRYLRFPDLRIRTKTREENSGLSRLPVEARIFRGDKLTSSHPPGTFVVHHHGKSWVPGKGFWSTGERGMERLRRSDRLIGIGNTLSYVRYMDDFNAIPVGSVWIDTMTAGFASDKTYVVQTNPPVIERCLLMATDPGDIVFDPTCGSGTTAYVAEQWGRRWITIDTSRVALALARTRIMAARYPWYLLADSPEGRRKEQEVSRIPQPDGGTFGNLRQGFVYERAPHVTLKSIANNAEIDVIWEHWQAQLEPLRAELNAAVGKTWEDWEIPREAGPAWPEGATRALAKWWDARIARQKDIDASIARAADVELLYDRPYVDPGRVRVAGPFTVESLSPHRGAPEADLGEEGEAAQGQRLRVPGAAPPADFAQMVLETLKAAGVQGRDKADRVRFTSISPWPGQFIGGEGRYEEGPEGARVERRAAIFIGPEFGTASRPDLIAAAREAADARFDLLVSCAFAYDAHASGLRHLGALPIVQAKMNPDLHMAQDLKNTGAGNLFVVFGEPDIDIERLDGDMLRVKVNGVDVFDPNTGEVRSNDTKGIAAWFIDTDYDEESFFVRHAYFLGANDPYKSLKTTLKAEIDEAAWATLYRDVSRPFPRPASGRIAIKVINHFGDEVMKVERV
jgi:adenine-specific DNA-methyltransferase